MPRGHQPPELGAGSGPRGRDPSRWWTRGEPDTAPTGRVVDNTGCNAVDWWMCDAPNAAFTGRIVDIDSTQQAATRSGGSCHQDMSSRGGRPTSQGPSSCGVWSSTEAATRSDAGCVVDQTP